MLHARSRCKINFLGPDRYTLEIGQFSGFYLKLRSFCYYAGWTTLSLYDSTLLLNRTEVAQYPSFGETFTAYLNILV